MAVSAALMRHIAQMTNAKATSWDNAHLRNGTNVVVLSPPIKETTTLTMIASAYPNQTSSLPPYHLWPITCSPGSGTGNMKTSPATQLPSRPILALQKPPRSRDGAACQAVRMSLHRTLVPRLYAKRTTATAAAKSRPSSRPWSASLPLCTVVILHSRRPQLAQRHPERRRRRLLRHHHHRLLRHHHHRRHHHRLLLLRRQ